MSSSEGEEEESRDDDDRQGRFEGRESTWRNYTRDERALAASLDQQRANDLSLHLLNAHALKVRRRQPQAVAEAKPWQSKQRWIARDQDGALPWQPPSSWTAWPLPLEDVPRRGEAFGGRPLVDSDENVANVKSDVPLPSTDLDAEIQAVMLRKGKERFHRIHWARSEASKAGEPGGGNGENDVDQPAKLPEDEQYFEPEILADEEQTHEILGPTTRHTLHNLDDLLMGLHKSRQGHRRQPSASHGSSGVSQSRSRSRSKAPARSRSSVRPSKRRRVEPGVKEETYQPSSSASNDTSDFEDAKTSKRRPSGASKHPLGLRDWSEVLGIASLVGWDPAVVDRAAKRCAALFGESMSFITMPETTVYDKGNHITTYTPDAVPLADEESNDEDISPAAETRQYYFCPYAQCQRQDEPYSIAWRWREHLKRIHKLDSQQIQELEGKLELNSPSSEDDEAMDGESATTDDENLDDREEYAGGVHVDGFLQPMDVGTMQARDNGARLQEAKGKAPDRPARVADRSSMMQ